MVSGSSSTLRWYHKFNIINWFHSKDFLPNQTKFPELLTNPVAKLINARCYLSSVNWNQCFNSANVVISEWSRNTAEMPDDHLRANRTFKAVVSQLHFACNHGPPGNIFTISTIGIAFTFICGIRLGWQHRIPPFPIFETNFFGIFRSYLAYKTRILWFVTWPSEDLACAASWTRTSHSSTLSCSYRYLSYFFKPRTKIVLSAHQHWAFPCHLPLLQQRNNPHSPKGQSSNWPSTNFHSAKWRNSRLLCHWLRFHGNYFLRHEALYFNWTCYITWWKIGKR